MAIAPRQVIYCEVCTMPTEYCVYGVTPAKCRTWLEDHHPELFQRHYGCPAGEGGKEATVNALTEQMQASRVAEEENKGHQTRGGKGLLRDETKKEEKERQKRRRTKVLIELEERNRRKSITHIKNLELFELDLKKVAKRLASKYACGCSVVQNAAGIEEVVLQGDYVDDLVEFIPQEWPEILEEQIEIISKK